MELIRDFSGVDKNDASLAGGKGASLGEMTKVGIPVPPGFVVLAAAFERFLEETDLNIEIDSILHSVNHKEIHTVENASEKIKALILEAGMPKDIADEIKKSFKKLGAKYVAVRSSATAEDSASAAWAGQLESYLNTTEKNLLENVKRCWASLFTPRAIFYRFEKELHHQKISVAVVVQKMIQSEISGIAFSVHPVTEDRNQLIIEAGFGLGEAIVSGQITPDSYVVEKQPRRIIDKNIAIQERAMARGKSGGTEWIPISKTESERQTLSDKQILELSELILRIENHYGFPCDIEWAEEKRNFYIVQSRPITTLPKLNSLPKPKILFKKIFNRSLPLVDCQYWDLGERIELPKICKNAIFFDPLFIYSAGKGTAVYYNFSDIKQNPDLLVDYFNRNGYEFYKLLEEYKKLFRLISEVRENNPEVVFQLLSRAWPALVLSNVSANIRRDKTNEEMAEEAYRLRANTDRVLYDASAYFLKILRSKIKREFIKHLEFLTLEEIISARFPREEELAKRHLGYIYFRGKVYAGDVAEFLERLNILLEDETSAENVDAINGSVARPGKAEGKVKVVFEYGQMDKVEDGDILVASMTTPNFLPAMKKAAAFVTDEGGITCHAAIAAREMNKPCIIGTKIATKVLKDGDLVEVDADKGIVRKIG
ncbi:MAG: PEP/pyruvate-binding domain-containing protein [bacterium]|nr:PEP/pyruvate-binding domain-containing protein [bacterium]